jgi:hypothetical protein
MDDQHPLSASIYSLLEVASWEMAVGLRLLVVGGGGGPRASGSGSAESLV